MSCSLVSQPRSIALFGTSADPPTRGHQAILTWLAAHFDQVAVWAADNPFKAHRASLDRRMGMLQALVRDLDPRGQHVSVEPDLSDRRTVLTVQRARQRWPEAELWLVVGSDLINQMPTWARIQEIFADASLLVVPRPGYAIATEALDRLRSLGANVELASLKGLPVSSTAYRERGAREHLPEAVEAYIQREGLYWQEVS